MSRPNRAPRDADGGDVGYREVRVPPPLAGALVCLWSWVVPEDGPGRSEVLPDACTDVVVVNGEEPWEVGPATSPVTAEYPAGTVIVGARFRPGHATGWLRVPANAILNIKLPLRDVWGSMALPMQDAVAAAPSACAKRTALATLLRGRLAAAGGPDVLADAAVHWIAAHPASALEDLARRLAVSDRQLPRRMTGAVGYGPKTLQRILRLQRLLLMQRTSPDAAPLTLAALAVACGYADQAPLARDVRQLADTTPSALRRTSKGTLGLSDLYKTGMFPGD